MKTSIFTAALVVAISTSACAQMPLPMIDNKPAPVAAQPAPAKVNIRVNKLMIIAKDGDLIALAPRKNDLCGDVSFRLITGQAPGMTSAIMLASGIAFDHDVNSQGQPICVARLRPEMLPFLPAGTLQAAQFSATVKAHAETSDAIDVRSVCKPDICQFVPLHYKSADKSTTDKIAAQASALQARIGKLWDATGGKLVGGSEDCNTDYQCQNNDTGTVGDSIKQHK